MPSTLTASPELRSVVLDVEQEPLETEKTGRVPSHPPVFRAKIVP